MMTVKGVCVKLSLGLVILTHAISSIVSPDGGQPVIRPEDECSDPLSAYVNCSYLPEEFIDCKPPEDLKGNDTRKEELGYGCTKFGGQKYDEVEKTKVWCVVLPGIECCGNKTFMVDSVPCIRYSGHYFVTTLIYSVLLGFIGLDRFCLGHTGTAVGKLLTLGGVGIWWIVDIVLLVTGGLMPEDGSNWQPYV